MTTLKIYSAMKGVQDYMMENPLAKNQKNEYQNYKYRGIEVVVQAFSKPLADNSIILLPQDIKVSTRFINNKTTLTRISGTLRFLVWMMDPM